MSRLPAMHKGQSPHYIFSPRFHLILYGVLLVATPLVMVRNYLQQAIGQLTKFTFSIGNLELPTFPTIVLLGAVCFLVYIRHHIIRRHVITAAIVLAMVVMSARINDFYSSHKFYDLQQNWHYIAYAIFALIAYRDLHQRGVSPSKMMIGITYSAFIASAFDETFQIFMSGRVFDMGDIAKDVWGAIMGLVVLYVGGPSWEILKSSRKQLLFPTLREHWVHPFSTLLLLSILSFIFLNIASRLTDPPNWWRVTLLTIAIFSVFFLLLHLAWRNWVRYSLTGLFGLIFLVQITAFAMYHDEGIMHNYFGLTVYKGIPVPYFDMMIFPDGEFRLVDKKHEFNVRDRQFFLKQGPDILIIGSGMYGKGGHGWATNAPSHFEFNPFTKRATQVILQETPAASQTFNRLRAEGKNVLFVLHSTC